MVRGTGFGTRLGVGGGDAEFVGGEEFAGAGAGELDGGDVGGFDGEGEEGDGVAGGFARRRGGKGGAVEELSFAVEGFENGRGDGGAPEGHRDFAGRGGEGGADGDGLGGLGRYESFVAGGEVGEEHEQAFAFALFGFVGEGEDDAFLLPAGEAVGFLVGTEGHGGFKIDDDGIGRQGWHGGGQTRQKADGEAGGGHALLLHSRPVMRPVEEANLLASMPMRCSMETNRLGRG